MDIHGHNIAQTMGGRFVLDKYILEAKSEIYIFYFVDRIYLKQIDYDKIRELEFALPWTTEDTVFFRQHRRWADLTDEEIEEMIYRPHK